MVWFQRVWLALLLAIAGGGPLPLWLHHMQCHCSGDGGVCGEESLHCTHHGHVHHAHAESGAKKTRIPQARSTGSEHEPCAGCYCLSQLSLNAAFQTVAVSSNCILLQFPSPDQIPEFDLLAAYSSRAPPAI